MKIRYRSSNNRNDYYEMIDPRVFHPITIVHTQFETLVCMTCRSIDCQHSKFAQEADLAALKAVKES